MASLKSKIFSSALGKIPSIDWTLSNLGIESVMQAKAGNTLLQTTNSMLQTTNHKNITYNIVMVSSPYRVSNIDECDVSNYDNFMNNWNSAIIDCLNQMQKWGEENNQHILLIGGQCPLPIELFETLENRSNLHLLSECIISELVDMNGVTTPISPKFGPFRVCDFTQHISIKYDKRLVDHIYEDLNRLEFQYDYVGNMLFWPDGSHLNFSAMIALLDKIFYKIEKLEGE
jgi:hypothetical protein